MNSPPLKEGDRVWYTGLDNRQDTGTVIKVGTAYPKAALVKYESGKTYWTLVDRLERI